MITQYLLPKGQFIEEVTQKHSIVFHHTAGGGTPKNEVDNWINDKQGAIGTHYVIGRDGSIVQAIKDEHWAYALGVQNANYKTIEKQSIQIELIAYGYLTKRGNDWITAYGQVMKKEDVCELATPFKGFKAFHKYTDAQIDALKLLIPMLCEKHNIKGCLGMSDFAISNTALSCGTGFWTHNCFRADKTDVFPQPNLIEAFKKGWHKDFSS